MPRPLPGMSSAVRTGVFATHRASTACQRCGATSSRLFHAAKPAALSTGPDHRSSLRRTRQRIEPARISDRRPLNSAAAPNWKSTSEQGKHGDEHDTGTSDQSPAKARGRELSSVTGMMAYLENGKSKVIAHHGVPPEGDVNAALQSCMVVADYIMDESVQPQIAHMVKEMDSSASNLLSLDPSAKATVTAHSSPSSQTAIHVDDSISAQQQRVIDKISHTAYEIVAHPTVVLTPSLLARYVQVQGKLGKPETLPRVFDMFASKPQPRKGSSGSMDFARQNPNRIASAIETEVVEKALDVAVVAKNLDAAVGIVENSYAKNAFLRSKLVRHATLPIGTLVATPPAAYILASNFSGLQNAMEPKTATNVAFAGILAYVGFTASLGLVALTTANDQMQRVSWAPGVPLRKRWMREEERAALDKIACAWGFQEEWRRGEESGREWGILREYILSKGMILDRAELLMGE